MISYNKKGHWNESYVWDGCRMMCTLDNCSPCSIRRRGGFRGIAIWLLGVCSRWNTDCTHRDRIRLHWDPSIRDQTGPDLYRRGLVPCTRQWYLSINPYQIVIIHNIAILSLHKIMFELRMTYKLEVRAKLGSAWSVLWLTDEKTMGHFIYLTTAVFFRDQWWANIIITYLVWSLVAKVLVIITYSLYLLLTSLLLSLPRCDVMCPNLVPTNPADIQHSDLLLCRKLLHNQWISKMNKTK